MVSSALLRSSAITTIGTTAAMLGLGRRHATTTWAPLDAVSHIAWGDRAFAHDGLDIKHSLVGAILNTCAMAAYAWVQGRVTPRGASVPWALATGATIALLGYVLDYRVVPERLRPGFEHVLPPRATKQVFVALALSLAAGALATRARRCARDDG